MVTLRYRSLLVAQAATVAVGTCAYIVYSHLSPARKLQIAACNSIPDSFRHSTTVTRMVNPRNHVCLHDSVTAVIDLPADHRSITDEIILAQFIKGFFGGYVLLPERTVFRTFRPKITNFSSE